MNWNEAYSKSNQPELSTISAYVNNSLWESLLTHLNNTYQAEPIIEYSRCSGAPGWNLKYRKSGRALCVLYPAQGFFTCMISVGSKEAMEAELLLPACTDYLQQLYWDTALFNGGRWLMIAVTSPEILEDVKILISLRVKKRQ